jgi:hypothetical protein
MFLCGDGTVLCPEHGDGTRTHTDEKLSKNCICVHTYARTQECTWETSHDN